MTCRTIALGVVVCGIPNPTNCRKRYLRCPVCQCITEHVVLYELWYGNTETCCRCGDRWCDGELWQRPFERGWRKKAVARARQLWDAATHGPPPSFDEELSYLDGDWNPDEAYSPDWNPEVTFRPVVTVELPPMPEETP